jgi:hypothetical protein
MLDSVSRMPHSPSSTPNAHSRSSTTARSR